jgi:hypothetical protein
MPEPVAYEESRQRREARIAMGRDGKQCVVLVLPQPAQLLCRP